MQGTMSAIAAVASESLGANCEITMGTETLAFLDAERACNRQGGHLASIHNEQEADYARALIANSPFAAQAEAWCVPATRTGHPKRAGIFPKSGVPGSVRKVG